MMILEFDLLSIVNDTMRCYILKIYWIQRIRDVSRLRSQSIDLQSYIFLIYWIVYSANYNNNINVRRY